MSEFTVYFVYYEQLGPEKEDRLWLDGVRVRGERLARTLPIIKAAVAVLPSVKWPVRGYLNTNTSPSSFHFLSDDRQKEDEHETRKTA